LIDPEIVCLDGTKPTTPRSLEYLIKALQVHQKSDVFLVASGQIGSEAAVAFCNFLSNPHTLTISHLINITPEVAEIIRETQKQADSLSTLNHWSNVLISYVKEEAKRKDNTEFVNFIKNPDLAKIISNYIVNIESFEYLSHFMNQLTDILEQETSNIEAQLTFIKNINSNATKNALKHSLEKEIKKQ
jgi:translation initiation factor 2B subunit (eIF-2B alpha/beta/delta family)